MGKYLRGNDEEEMKRPSAQAVSIFAQKVLANVGGSQVFIEPRKVGKLIHIEDPDLSKQL